MLDGFITLYWISASISVVSLLYIAYSELPDIKVKDVVVGILWSFTPALNVVFSVVLFFIGISAVTESISKSNTWSKLSSTWNSWMDTVIVKKKEIT